MENSKNTIYDRDETPIWRIVLKWFFYLAPLFIGVYGYYIVGESRVDFVDGKETITIVRESSLLHAIYSTISLYALNLASDIVNGWVHVARFWAALVTSSFVLSHFSLFFERVRAKFAFIVSKFSDIAVVYTDSDTYDFLSKDRRVVFSKNKILVKCKNQILMYDDFKNLDFYEKNLKHFESRNVYMMMSSLDPYMIQSEALFEKESEEDLEGKVEEDLEGKVEENLEEKPKHKSKGTVRYFSIYETVARNFWKNNDLCGYISSKTGEATCKIAIIGFEQLGKQIFRQGFIYNLYSVNQKIEYFIWGDDGTFESQRDDWDEIFMNNDRCYFEGEKFADIRKLAEMDRVIITDENMLELAQMIMSVYPTMPVYFYSSRKRNLDKKLVGNLHEFGCNKEIVTLNNIKSDKLYKMAFMLNEDYKKKHGGSEWDDLSGFLKGSNIAAADYHEIRIKVNRRREKIREDKNGNKDIKDFSMDIENGELPKLEHIRWSRYYFINNWKYNQDRIDAEKKHDCLVEYGERLTHITRVDEKTKEVEVKDMRYNDLGTIKTLLGIYNDIENAKKKEQKKDC